MATTSNKSVAFYVSVFLWAPFVPNRTKKNWWHVEHCDLHTLVAVHKCFQPTCPERHWLSRCVQPTPPTALWTRSAHLFLPCGLPPSLTHWPTGGKRGHRASKSPLLECQMAIFFPKHSKKGQTYIKLPLLKMLVQKRSSENKGSMSLSNKQPASSGSFFKQHMKMCEFKEEMSHFKKYIFHDDV